MSKDDYEWEKIKLRIYDLENESTLTANVISQLVSRILYLEKTLGELLVDQYPHLFQRCKHCGQIGEYELMDEKHNDNCLENPDLIVH